MGQWNDMLKDRREFVANSLDDLRTVETDIAKKADESRRNIEVEIEALEAQLATKKSQLMKQIDGEAEMKINYVSENIGDCSTELKNIDDVLDRTAAVSELRSEYSFLAFCLPLIKDVQLRLNAEKNFSVHLS